jgi:NAD(P)H-dependent FMN reductase
MRSIIISGSLREKSYNTSVARMIGGYLKDKGFEACVVESNNLQLPLYNSDIRLEEFPKSVNDLKKSVEEADIIVFVSPEYNHSVSGVLKNAIDWLSGGDKNSLNGKVAMITGVSTGLYGTIRAQRHLREILAALKVYIVPLPEVYIGPAGKLFNEHNELIDEKTIEKLYTLIDETIKFAKKLQ